MARTRTRTAGRLATAAAILGTALTGVLILGPATKAVAAERLVTLTPPTTVGQVTPTLRTIPDITLPTVGPLEPAVPDGPDDLTDCPDFDRGEPGDNCPKPPKPPCDANHDGKLTAADWVWLLQHPDACRPKPPCDANGDGKITKDDWGYLKRHPDACRPKPPCDANGDGKLDGQDLLWLRRHPDACRPPKPPCDADGNGVLDQNDWNRLATDPEACQPPSTSFKPPTRIDTGQGGTADDGLNFGQLALIGAILAGVAGGIATVPRRRQASGSAR